jgi:hypothetical protein
MDTDSSDGEVEKPPPRKFSYSRRDDVEFNELNISLKISYKTLLLVFVLFDVFHKIANAVIDTNAIQSLLNGL